MKKLIFILLLFIMLLSMAVSAADEKAPAPRQRPDPCCPEINAGSGLQCEPSDVEEETSVFSHCRAFAAGEKT